MTETTKDEKLREKANNGYILLGVGGIMAFLPYTFIVICGLFAVIAGIIVSYNLRKSAEESNRLYQTHATWQIRTFWIANLVVFPVAMIINAILVSKFTVIGEIMNNALSGGYGMDISRLQSDFLVAEASASKNLILIKLATYGIALVWWLKRCYTGWTDLKNDDHPFGTDIDGSSPE